MNPAQISVLWTQALASPFGLAIKTDNPEYLKQLVYEARTASTDPRLQGFFLSKRGNELWIIRNQNTPEVKTGNGFEPLEE